MTVREPTISNEVRTPPDTSPYEQYQNKGVVVTDKDMVQEEIRQWVGYTFICPSCGEASILDIMKYCGNCGARVIINSLKVEKFKQLQSAQSRGD